MAYEFKKLSAVSTVNAPSEDAHVLIEENGSVKRVPKNAVGETAESVISKLGTVGSVDSTTDATNVIIEENGEIKRVPKNAVGETAESVISKLAEVTTADSTTDTTNVLIEEDGVVKKAPKSAVHGKRELVYEFTPGIDADGNPVTDVEMFVQNINEDLTWLTNSIEGIDFELELVQYGVYREATTDDSGNTVTNSVVDTDCEVTLKTGSAYSNIAFTKDKHANVETFNVELNGFPFGFSYQYLNTGARIGIMNKMQLNMETGEPTQVDIGGAIVIDSMPIKSIKIYKITY